MEKIGKYRVFERIGRGGMGTIYKAHDPILDRPVALKVISSEVEVTDGLRARFFREAQACARLSHPNIVTVYDMGEENGRLYIVMELLDGEELKRLIAKRTAMPVEEKISVMAQVCDGLHYAHQKGVVHRDIKPGNIMLLRNGQAKILDFGIAQIANSEGDLTRTGLIMGTLRYIAPEQVRGRADARSDIFSVGAVFYEFLSLQPPFTGDDPMQLLEQLRSEDPTPLDQLDPGLPPELARIVERAMRKHPDDRFASLQQMRAQLDQVQRGLGDEVQRIGARIRAQCDRLRELQSELAERIGARYADEEPPAIEECRSVAAREALEREIDARLLRVQGQIERAEALAPSLQHGQALLEAEQFADAVVELAAVVAEMPEHVQAADSLGRARAGAEVERRQRLAAQLLQDARRALSQAQYTLCLEILEQVSEIPAPDDASREVAALRETAEKLTAIEAARRARQQAEQSREQMAPARRVAEAAAAIDHAPDLWNEAEMKSAEAHKTLAAEQYAAAGEAFEAATAAYRRSADEARERQRREREALERARAEAAQSKEAARVAEVTRYARGLWEAAESKFAEAEAAGRGDRQPRASAVADLFSEAGRRYAAAARAARMAAEDEARRVAALLSEARALLDSTDATACLARVDEALALQPGDVAAQRLREQALEKQHEGAAVTALISPASDVILARDRSLAGGHAAAASSTDRTDVVAPAAPSEIVADPIRVESVVVPVAAAPRSRSVEDIDAVESIGTESESGWSWGRWARGILTVGAALAVLVVVTVYGLPRFTSSAPPPAERAVNPTPAPTGTPQTTAPPAPPTPGAGGRDQLPVQGSRDAKTETVARAVEPPAGETKRPAPAALPDRVATAKPAEPRGTPAKGARSAPAAPPDRVAPPKAEPRETGTKASSSAPSSSPGHVASLKPSEPRETGGRKNAEEARARLAIAKRAADEAAAAFYAPRRFSAARSKEEDGAAALVRSDYESAARLFGEAQSEYQAAAQEAKPGAEVARQEAMVQESRATTIARRSEARTAGAERLAKDAFVLAQNKHLEADRLDKARDFSAAAQAYRDAAKLYQEATQASQR